MTEDEIFGWHHHLNGHEFEQASGVGDREAWFAAVLGVAKSQSWLSELTDWPYFHLTPLSHFHHYHWAVSSSSYIAAAFMLASGHSGLEVKIVNYCTLYSTVKYIKVQPLVEDAWQCMPNTWTKLHDGHAKTGSLLWKFATWMFECRELTVLSPSKI